MSIKSCHKKRNEEYKFLNLYIYINKYFLNKKPIIDLKVTIFYFYQNTKF